MAKTRKKAIHGYMSVTVSGTEGNKYAERGNLIHVWRVEIYADGTCKSFAMDDRAVDRWWETRSRV